MALKARAASRGNNCSGSVPAGTAQVHRADTAAAPIDIKLRTAAFASSTGSVRAHRCRQCCSAAVVYLAKGASPVATAQMHGTSSWDNGNNNDCETTLQSAAASIAPQATALNATSCRSWTKPSSVSPSGANLRMITSLCDDKDVTPCEKKSAADSTAATSPGHAATARNRLPSASPRRPVSPLAPCCRDVGVSMLVDAEVGVVHHRTAHNVRRKASCCAHTKLHIGQLTQGKRVTRDHRV